MSSPLVAIPTDTESYTPGLSDEEKLLADQREAEFYDPHTNPTDLPAEHTWKGSGYRYTSEALGITIEFPPEWEGIFDIIEGNGGFSLNVFPRPRDPERDPISGYMMGNIGWIGFTNVRDKEALVNSRDWPITPHTVLYDENDGFVYMYHSHAPQVGYGESEEDMEIYVRYHTVYDGIINGEYEIYIG
jgi:hypothetical protein